MQLRPVGSFASEAERLALRREAATSRCRATLLNGWRQARMPDSRWPALLAQQSGLWDWLQCPPKMPGPYPRPSGLPPLGSREPRESENSTLWTRNFADGFDPAAIFDRD